MANEQRSQTISNVDTSFLNVNTTQQKVFQEIGCHLKLFKTLFKHYVLSIDSCPYIFNLFFVHHLTYVYVVTAEGKIFDVMKQLKSSIKNAPPPIFG